MHILYTYIFLIITFLVCVLLVCMFFRADHLALDVSDLEFNVVASTTVDFFNGKYIQFLFKEFVWVFEIFC